MRSPTSSFAGLAAFAGDELRVDIDCGPEQVMGQVAPGNYVEVLGVKPLLGRLINAGDEKLDPPVVVIAGVTPPEFFGVRRGWPVDMTLPIGTEGKALADSSDHWLRGIIGRLKPGTSREKA